MASEITTVRWPVFVLEDVMAELSVNGYDFSPDFEEAVFNVVGGNDRDAVV